MWRMQLPVSRGWLLGENTIEWRELSHGHRRGAVMSETLRMSLLDADLDAALRRRQKKGVVDIKCHVDVCATTNPTDFKRALLNVFKQDESGEVARVSVQDLKSFADLQRLFV
jgi:hypothetical protein